MKRLAALAAVVAGAFAAYRQWQQRRADAELWREATAPREG